MIGSQTLPAIAFVAAISGLPGLPGLKGLPVPASKEYKQAKAEAVAADTLPPPWKPSWRLALEDRFLQAGLAPIGPPRGPIKLLPVFDPRRVRVTLEPDSGSYVSAMQVGEVTLVPTYRRPLQQFTRELAAQTFRERWAESARQNINSLGSATPVQRTGISLPIPVKLPQRLSSILGPGGPSLTVRGSESIRLSGTSNWTNAQTSGLIGQRKSLFPSLDMQQDLDIQLEGQLSDRIKVNLLQNSANQVPLANRIAINYKGDEDDFVQALDLGNTNLSLPGTQYVSYSGKNEGLFGVKVASRVGALDMTALASKQEGRSERAVYSGGGGDRKSPLPISDLDWVRGQYFLLYDPNFGTVWDIDEKTIRLYLDDANNGNNQDFTLGKAVIDPDHAFNMPLPTVADTASVDGTFNLLLSGPDQQYEVLNNMYAFHDTLFKVIRLKQPIPFREDHTLAVSYRAAPVIGPNHQLGEYVDVGGRTLATTGRDSARILLKLLRAPRSEQKKVGLVFDTAAAFAVVRELELKNVYNLGAYGIDPKSFKLKVQLGQEEPPITELEGIPYFELVGLDNWSEQTSQAIPAPDGAIDIQGFNSQTRGWVDYVNGTLFLPDPRPFAPRLTGPGASAFDQFVNERVNRRRRLDGALDSRNAPNPGAYDLYDPQSTDADWFLKLEYTASRSGGSDITLGRGNILDNSEAVVVNGERWLRDRDYTIDYDLGRITLKRQLGPSDQLSVDYSYAPLFAQASKTLIGSAFRVEGRDRSVGGAFLYESKGAQDIRPRLGEEPSRTLITDLNTELRFKPAFLTRFADALPGVRTTAPSDFSVQAEAGMSFPNPNTRNEVYVDDMEGVRDAVSLSMFPDRWRWSSVPRRATTVVGGDAIQTESFLNLADYHNGELHWYVPVNTSGSEDDELVRERHLRPDLPVGQGSNNVRTVLALSIPKTPNPSLTAGYVPSDKLWAGLTYNLDAVGINLSRSQFIELWVSDFNDHHDPNFRTPRVRGDGTPGSSVKLHIDLGRVSEDQMRAPNRLPNGRVDTEDVVPRDNQLTTVGEESEDTGIDGINDDVERSQLAGGQLALADLVTASPTDPEGDNWGTVIETESAMDPRRYINTNGTERSKDAYPIPDTEDFNLNERPDSSEAYFEYTIDLGAKDSPYLATDVIRDFPGRTGVDSSNGWRRYRIPINDSLRVRFGSPDLTIAKHVRVWFEGLASDESAAPTRPTLLLGGLDIVGNRWLSSELTPRQRDTLRTTLTLNTLNTVDNAEIYKAPFDPGETRSGSDSYTRREQSLAMEFVDLHPADSLEAFKTFSLAEDYTRYGVLRWFASSFLVSKQDLDGTPQGMYDPAQDSLYYFVRFASDDKGQAYYEVKRRVPPSSSPPLPPNPPVIAWEEVLAELEKLSVVKLNPDFPTAITPGAVLYRTQLENGDSLILSGRPSFTRLRRVSFGVINQSTTSRYTGQLWFDELRSTEVAKDVGFANRVLVNGNWANLLNYNVSWNSRDADFLSVGETRGLGSRNTSLSVSSRFELHRFFEGTGIQLPVTFAQNDATQRPRFTAGDDIVRSGELAEASLTKTVTRTISTNYSRVWSERSNALLRYTLGGIRANINRTTTDSRQPTAVSNARTVTAGVNYLIAPRQLLTLELPFTKARFYPLPERFYWDYGVTTTSSTLRTSSFVGDTLRPSTSQNGRSATVNFGADSRPIDLLSHHIEAQRELALEGVKLERVGFINFGRLTSWRQSFASNVTVNPVPMIRPTFNWSSNYGQTNGRTAADIGQRQISNSTELSMNMELPFDKLAMRGMAAPRPQPKTDSAGATVKPPGRPLVPWRGLLSRLGALSTDWRISRTSNYSRVSGTASPLYLLGLADNPGFGSGQVFSEAGNLATNGLDWRANARTSIPIVFGSSMQARASYGDQNRDVNGDESRDREWRFPDVELAYGQVATMLGITRLLENPQLRSSYARSHVVNYSHSQTLRTGTSRSDDFRPLFSIRGRLKNGTDADLRLERRSTVRESFLSGSSRATDQTTDVNFSLSRSYTQGQKVNILGKTTTVRTNVSLALTSTYSRQKGGIKVGNQAKLANPKDLTRLSMTGTGSYGFSTNVTGDLALGFSHFRETTGIIRRSVRVELRGQFRF